MGVKLNIFLLVLLVATISSQGFNLRKEDDSKDEKPFGVNRRDGTCQNIGGYCTSTDDRCPPGFRANLLPGCSPDFPEVCCLPEHK
ncbi:small cysteine-rich protein 3-like isoform X2 [Acropora millepora]|uniref:small cysteine-rich protein 3-like isoform X2 n=1 Tax=Acropora millepora TaxID=45264 RepID=UPI001CF391FD|nr:small cysteine-rich protein 3-like isoform X2 [Acropora millepora]XP_044176487.1 small cysteine-rich protein 3-like isoform X2 [Acropora millepora]